MKRLTICGSCTNVFISLDVFDLRFASKISWWMAGAEYILPRACRMYSGQRYTDRWGFGHL